MKLRTKRICTYPLYARIVKTTVREVIGWIGFHMSITSLQHLTTWAVMYHKSGTIKGS